jgi:hypothetical protein
MGAHDRISSDPAICRHDEPNGVHRWSHPELDTLARSIRTGIKQIFVLALKKLEDHLLY